MNTASLELSKELYELSGWGDTLYYWRLHKPSGRSKLYTFEEMDSDRFRFRANTEPNNRFREENEFFNAYDLGFLLRKLPTPTLKLDPLIKEWIAQSNYTENRLLKAWGDTPEDAVCKLAIELFKQGVLKKDES